MYFLVCAHEVVLITDQFWIQWFFGKNVNFWPKNQFFGKKWLFDPLSRFDPQSCFRTFCSGANFLPFYGKKKFQHFPAKNVRPIFLFLPSHFWPYFINFSHQKGSRQYISVYNSNIQLLYDTTLLNFLFHFGSFRPEAEPYWPPGGYLGVA